MNPTRRQIIATLAASAIALLAAGGVAAQGAKTPDALIKEVSTDVLDALDGVTAVGLGKENSGVRTAEAYVRGRQNPDGLWYPGSPARPDAAPKAAGTAPKEREPARWLTVRVLIILRRVN